MALHRITKKKLLHYFEITDKALKIAENSVRKGKENEAKEIISMVKNYLSDSKYFQEKKDYLSSFAAINYAHGWLDCGVRLGIFNVKDNSLFVLK
ncbi:MAG: hypothetical protein KatS3mg001_122 [Candidatus Pacearchaeota archaeon]|nr:MAG: hypothetical protein KatS3mg001_122 [Candidatus Pacearchaeota archaeon]